MEPSKKIVSERRSSNGHSDDFRILVDADLFISYLTSDDLESHFVTLVKWAKEGKLQLVCSSEIYDDIATALRTNGVSARKCSEFLADIQLIPHDPLPVTSEISSNALQIYSEFGGRRKLHYFDAFHVSTARSTGLTFYTSDKYMISNSKRLGVSVVDVRKI